ncbi:hypothetical protein FGG08_000969 [Glutinoglossum americanum]|uniref:Uncharacterized protein n=1 Tax=Glutinoglossum americanum TaxID=1670608 RepID=A0A9P8L5Q2_9PEZI|nr:hypothetical protein FGG08_000969 [Glutinoglossum americanum]
MPSSSIGQIRQRRNTSTRLSDDDFKELFGPAARYMNEERRMRMTASGSCNDVSDIDAPDPPVSHAPVSRDLSSSQNPAVDASSVAASPVAWRSPAGAAVAGERAEEQGWGGWGGE